MNANETINDAIRTSAGEGAPVELPWSESAAWVLTMLSAGSVLRSDCDSFDGKFNGRPWIVNLVK